MVKFKEFETALRDEVENFLRSYFDNNATMPDEYPLEYPSIADWWEQFDCTVEKGDSE